MASFVDGIPVYSVRLPLQILGVALVVAALPPLTVITAEVVPPALRGTAFGLLKLCANVLAAVAPPSSGRWPTRGGSASNGEVVGDLGSPSAGHPADPHGLALLLYGRRHIQRDLERALHASD